MISWSKIWSIIVYPIEYVRAIIDLLNAPPDVWDLSNEDWEKYKQSLKDQDAIRRAKESRK